MATAWNMQKASDRITLTEQDTHAPTSPARTSRSVLMLEVYSNYTQKATQFAFSASTSHMILLFAEHAFQKLTVNKVLLRVHSHPVEYSYSLFILTIICPGYIFLWDR
jgi:hypothetical protein